jgi:L-rhamnose mutarotase
MLRKGFLMHLNPGMQAEYQRRHDAIWPELADTLRQQGVHSYSIFLEPERSLLFGYVEIESIERWDAIAETPVCRRWWSFMRDLMATNPDHSPVSQEIQEVFRLQPPPSPGGQP